MAENGKGRKIPPPEIRYSYKLTEEQKEFIRKAAKQYEKQSAGKKKELRKILIPILIILFAFIIVYLCKKQRETIFPADDRLAVHFIDVGQGDSVFLTASGATMLIDSGEATDTDRVISYLQKGGVKRIDYVVGTHPHSDHMGGMSRIIETFDVGEVIIPHLDDSDFPVSQYFERFLDACDEKGLGLTEAETGRIIEIGDARAEIIAPVSDDYGNVNNYSVGIFLTHGSSSFIFTGDAEKLAEDEMISVGRLGHADVYKVGHHGSDTSSSQKFLDIITPDYAVISCGEGNSYGHPCDVTLEKLSRFTDKIYRTDLCGNIVFESDGETLSVRTERD